MYPSRRFLRKIRALRKHSNCDLPPSDSRPRSRPLDDEKDEEGD